MIFYLGLPLTIIIFLLSKMLYKRKSLPIFHPFLVSLTLLIIIHLLFNLDYNEYASGTKFYPFY